MSNPGPNITVTSNLTQDFVPGNSDGHNVGSSPLAYIALWGATPVQQPKGAAQALVVDASGGTAAPSNGILTLTASYNSSILANAIATIAAQTNAIQAALVAAGVMKGSA